MDSVLWPMLVFRDMAHAYISPQIRILLEMNSSVFKPQIHQLKCWLDFHV